MKKLDTQLVEFCKNIAINGHSLQFRNDGKTPYITHVEQVARLTTERMTKYKFSFKEILIGTSAAWLHDLVEDQQFTGITFNTLELLEIPDSVLYVVKDLTKITELTYEQNIERICKSKISTVVKICDNLANLSDFPSNNQIFKYSNSLNRLVSELTKTYL